jgi:hypothetical protein
MALIGLNNQRQEGVTSSHVRKRAPLSETYAAASRHGTSTKDQDQGCRGARVGAPGLRLRTGCWQLVCARQRVQFLSCSAC